MAKITLNGVDALTESGGVVTIPGAANLTLGTGAVPSAAIQDDAVTTAKLQDDAVTSAKLDTNIAVGGTLGVTGATTLSSTLGVTGATTLSSTLGVTGATTLSSTLAVTGTSTLTGDVTCAGNLTVNGTTTTIDTANLIVEDKNIEIASVGTPSDTTCEGAGLTIKGGTIQSTYHNSADKTFTWTDGNQEMSFVSSHKIAENKGSSFAQRPFTAQLILGN